MVLKEDWIRKYMYWMEKNMFEITEKNLINQIRAIIRKGLLTEVQIESIRRNVRWKNKMKERQTMG